MSNLTNQQQALSKRERTPGKMLWQMQTPVFLVDMCPRLLGDWARVIVLAPKPSQTIDMAKNEHSSRV